MAMRQREREKKEGVWGGTGTEERTVPKRGSCATALCDGGQGHPERDSELTVAQHIVLGVALDGDIIDRGGH